MIDNDKHDTAWQEILDWADEQPRHECELCEGDEDEDDDEQDEEE